MDVTLIDPRDAKAEVDSPTYRVEIISRDRSRIGTWRVSGAQDLHEVLAWSESEKGDGSAVIHVESRASGGALTLHRVHGVPYGHRESPETPGVGSSGQP